MGIRSLTAETVLWRLYKASSAAFGREHEPSKSFTAHAG
jgi:hypothetical protein